MFIIIYLLLLFLRLLLRLATLPPFWHSVSLSKPNFCWFPSLPFLHPCVSWFPSFETMPLSQAFELWVMQSGVVSFSSKTVQDNRSSCNFASVKSRQQTKPKRGPNEKLMKFRPFLWILVFFPGKASAIHIELLFQKAPGKSSWTGLSLVWSAGVTPDSARHHRENYSVQPKRAS